MRGRSRSGWSTAPTAWASRATSGVSTRTSRAEDTRPHVAGPSWASRRMASVNEMAISMPDGSTPYGAFLATAPRIRRTCGGGRLDVRGSGEVLVERVAIGDRVDAVGQLGLALLEARRERRGDDPADLDEVLGLQAAGGERRGADAQAARHGRRA